jgi:riboflavin biosynthesis pyrimidine reductase
MYETMTYWETVPGLADEPACIQDFAEIWRAADKVVYSTTLEVASSARTRIERGFDPATVRHLKAKTERDLTVGGAGLASHAFAAGLVDRCHLFVAPAVVGGGTRALPDRVRCRLKLLDERRFDNGFVFLHYRVAS